MDIFTGIYTAFKVGCWVAAFVTPIISIVWVFDWMSKTTPAQKERET